MAKFKDLPKPLEDLLKKLRPTVRRGFLQAISGMTSTAVLKDVTDAITRLDAAALQAALNLDEAFFGPLDRAIREIYWQAGNGVALAVPASKRVGTLTPFDGRKPRAELWVRNQSATLITNVLEDQKGLVRAVLESGLRTNRHPSTIALDLVGRVNKLTGRREGGFIGQTEGQGRAILGVRDKLSSGDPDELRKYLNLQLRDRRFDATVEAAIKSGKPIPAARVNTIVGRYTDRSLKHRANVIAENESRIAMEAARQEGYEQLIENGTLDKDQVRTTWRHSGNPHPRADHVAMDGKSIDFDGIFVLPDGVLMKHPHDPDGGAKHNIGCGCWTDFVVANPPKGAQ